MRILTLGGTIFFGREFVRLAIAAGHEVTLFHRGRHGADLFPDSAHVLGDRDGGVGLLPDGDWDAVVDTCGFVPRVVSDWTRALQSRTGRYLYVSSISVYADGATPLQTEDAPVGQIADPTMEEITGESYGPLKALCEVAVREAFGDRSMILRPGLIIGPNDQSNRFSEWVKRFATSESVIVPDRPDQPMQMIDARDLARFALRLIENNASGTIHATGPDNDHNFGDLVEACRSLNPSAEPIWTSEEELKAKGLELWTDLPLALPFDRSVDGMMNVDIARAIEAGLTFIPWSQSASDIWAMSS